MGTMISACLIATGSVAKLIGLSMSLGWRDKVTWFLLFDMYMFLSLLYGGLVWGMESLRQDGRVVWTPLGI